MLFGQLVLSFAMEVVKHDHFRGWKISIENGGFNEKIIYPGWWFGTWLLYCFYDFPHIGNRNPN